MTEGVTLAKGAMSYAFALEHYGKEFADAGVAKGTVRPQKVKDYGDPQVTEEIAKFRSQLEQASEMPPFNGKYRLSLMVKEVKEQGE